MQIDRIEMPCADFFYTNYMAKLQPVVINNLFAGEELRSINTIDQARLKLGDMKIGIQPEYNSAYEGSFEQKEPGSKEGQLKVSFNEYWGFLSENPDTNLMAIEYPSPNELKSLYRVPDVCMPRVGESDHLVNQCFVGNKNNHAHIHFDKAGSHGFLYQVFGVKKFYTFPLHATHRLAPLDQISLINLENFSLEDKRDFLQYTGGVEVTLGPGDCMYIPAFSWHYVEYPEHSMSVSLRFRRNNSVTRLVNALRPNFCLQGLASLMMLDTISEKEKERMLTEFEDIWNSPSMDGVAKQNAIDQKALDLYSCYFSDQRTAPYYMAYAQYMPDFLPQYRDAHSKGRKIYY